MNWELFAAFMVVATILFVTPGPVVTLVIATGVSHGIRAGLTTVAGSSVGLALLLTAIALGLTWVLQHAATIFEKLRYLGAAYLVWVGIGAWRNAGKPASVVPSSRASFLRGLAVALSNPKTIVFFTAFLPQFVDSGLPAGPQLATMLRDVGRARGHVRFRLGRRGRTEPRVALEASTREAAWPPIGRRAGRRRRLAVVGAATARA